MPSAAPKGCRFSGCSELVHGGVWCPQHKPQAESERHLRTDRWRGSSSARGYGSAWRKRRLRVLAREPLCRHCKAEGLSVPANEVDHIVRLSDGGTNRDDNLQPLCKSCHSAKTAREGRRG